MTEDELKKAWNDAMTAPNPKYRLADERAPMTNDELDLVPTDDIVDALGRRGPVLVVLLRSISDSKEQPFVHYRGGYITAKGLAHEAVEYMRCQPTLYNK